MKIICLQENLKNALTAAERIIGKNLTLPILNNILLKASNGKLQVSSTNLEIGINYWIPCKTEKDGEITVLAKTLSSFVANLPNKKVELESKDELLAAHCEGYRAKIKGQSAEDFPIIPKIQAAEEISVDAFSLKEGLAQTAPITSISEVRPEISGVLFDFKKKTLKLVATDSFRLAEKNIFLESGCERKIIVPQKTALEINRILTEKIERADKEEKIKILIGPSQAMFDAGYIQIISRLIDGQYPDYQQIIPKSFRSKVTLARDEAIKAIRIASLFSGKVNDIKMNILPNKKIIEITAQSADIGENKSQIIAEIEGESQEVAYNWRYFLDGLSNAAWKSVFIGANSDQAPTIIKPTGNEDYLYVVMPIKAV